MSVVVRLLQSLPLIIFLAVLAGVIYLVVSWVKSPARAKEILIEFFTVFTIGLCVFFALATAYTLLEHNQPIFELAVSFLVVAAVALGITQLCRWRFIKHNPHYKYKRTRAKLLRK